MPYSYLAILGGQDRSSDAARSMRFRLGKSGLLPRLCTESVTLFATAETPTLLASRNSVLVGRVFRTDGTPLRDGAAFPASLDQQQLREFLMEHCWGDYVLLQSSPGGTADTIVMRDPSGGVPCFYSTGPELRFLTSDVSLATEHGLHRKHIDWEFIAQCLIYPHQVTQGTALTGIRELLPGSLLRLCDAEIATEQAWSPWDFVSAERREDSAEEAAARVRESVLTATRAWAEIDRSVLLELSGGLDSSILAACLRHTTASVSCCTLVTPVPGADERQYARLVTDDLGVELHVEELDFGLARFDAPPPPWSVAPRINILQHALNETMSTVGELEGVNSHFSGGGGDTIFCYLGNAAPAADAFRERGVAAGLNSIRDLSHLHQCTLWKAARLTLNKLFRRPKGLYEADFTLLGPEVPHTPPACHPWFESPPGALPGDQRRIQLLAGTQLYRHAMSRGTRDLRMPLLAQPVVEACLTVPAWMWIAGGRNRSVARAAFADHLPGEVLNRRSKGDFSQYLGAVWRRNKDQMRDYLLDGELQARGLLAPPDTLRDFFQRHLAPRDESFFRIFDLCKIESWVRHQG